MCRKLIFPIVSITQGSDKRQLQSSLSTPIAYDIRQKNLRRQTMVHRMAIVVQTLTLHRYYLRPHSRRPYGKIANTRQMPPLMHCAQTLTLFRALHRKIEP